VASGGTTSAASQFIRSLAVLSNGTIISLTQSGFITLPGNFDATTAKPVVSSVINTSDPSQKLTSGGPISVLGSNLSSGSASSSASPAPTVLADSCVTVNGALIPLFSVAPTRINGQLPLGTVSGSLIVHTPGGESDPFNFSTVATAPSVVQCPGPSSICSSFPSGPGTDQLPAVIRAENNLPANFVNPIHKGDHLIIFTTGLGPTTPAVPAGTTAPSNPPAVVIAKPTVFIDGATCPVTLAILEPGQIGLYRIEVDVPFAIQQGYVGLYITQNGISSGTLTVRVVQ
jgi:uncharacterized protein (TIGR03437 family)